MMDSSLPETQSKPTTSCPCCQFLPDLFLPSTTTPSSNNRHRAEDDLQKNKEEEEGDDDEEEEQDPTLLMQSSSSNPISFVATPQQAWKELLRGDSSNSGSGPRGVRLVDTHGHAHLERDSTSSTESGNISIYSIADDDLKNYNNHSNTQSALQVLPMVSLTCAVAPSDWLQCIAYASKSPFRIAALGVHPWYIDQIIIPCNTSTSTDSMDGAKERQHSKDQDPTTSNSNNNNTNSDNCWWLDRLRNLLLEHPGCMVGEIGLCKQAKFLRTYPPGKSEALQLQRETFVQQLRLAAELQRSVSIHCVNQQGVLLQVLKELVDHVSSTSSTTTTKPLLPPAIALHSFTGTAHQVQQLLQWEESLLNRDQELCRRRRPLLYFGFSHSVNYAMCSSEKSRRQGRDAIRAVPRHRILVESDVSSSQDVVGGTVAAIAYVAWALDEPDLSRVADFTAQNGLQFLQQQQMQQMQPEK